MISLAEIIARRKADGMYEDSYVAPVKVRSEQEKKEASKRFDDCLAASKKLRKQI